MFYEASSFNSDISNWEVGRVTNMFQMFFDASSFNSDILNWDVSSVTTMVGMFEHASSFNSDISNWDVSSVTDMEDMFYQASSFNSDISRWEVGRVTDVGYSSVVHQASIPKFQIVRSCDELQIIDSQLSLQLTNHICIRWIIYTTNYQVLKLS